MTWKEAVSTLSSFWYACRQSFKVVGHVDVAKKKKNVIESLCGLPQIDGQDKALSAYNALVQSQFNLLDNSLGFV